MRFNSCFPFHISFSAAAILFPCWSSSWIATMRTGQQPTNIPNKRNARPETRQPTKTQGRNIQLQQHLPTREKLQTTEKASSTQTWELKAPSDTPSHVQALEGNHGILPDQRHLLRHAVPRPQENRKHATVCAAYQQHLPRPRRQIHLQSSQNRARSSSASRVRL